MLVAAYTGGLMIPSARARVRQYIAPLARMGIEVREYPLPWGNILPKKKALRPLWMPATAFARMASLVRSWTADVTWISRQLLPAFIPLQGLAHRPMILDVDDAVWLNSGGRRAAELARACDVVVCGNSYLAERFACWNSNVAVIPTAVDTTRYRPPAHTAQTDAENSSAPVLGWIGTSGNFPFLYAIEPALERVFHSFPQAKLLVVADRPPLFEHLAAHQVEFQLWSPQAELVAFARMTIGLMPLVDNEWCRGKCSYKMLCYMAAALPVVVSATGMNRELLALGEIGLSAGNEKEWIDGLIALLENAALRRQMGATGRAIVEQRFSLERLAQKYAAVFQSVGGAQSHGPLSA
jgi:glycosyltransferase involved in cell wall biosynthesis